MKYRLLTLGTSSLIETTESGDRVVFTYGKPIALLTYLCFMPSRTASREHLCRMLWGDSNTEKALGALRQVLWQIGERMGKGAAVVSEGRNIALIADLDLDCDEFFRTLNSGDLAGAVALYTGDFMPHFAMPGAAELEIWAEGERQRLRSAFLMAGESTVRTKLDDGRFGEAQVIARRLKDADPLAENCRRVLLECLLISGDQINTELEVQSLKAMLSEERRQAEPATTELLARINETSVNGSSGADPQLQLVSDLIGREKEFSAIVNAWRSVKTGQAVHFHVVGEAGVGKTRLVQDVQNRLQTERAVIVYVRAHQVEKDIGMSLIGELVTALGRVPGATGISEGAAGHLLQVAPSLSSVFNYKPAEDASDQATALALRELIEAIADEQPVVIIVDDVHWGDERSRAMLASVSSRLRDEEILLVTTQRPPSSMQPGEHTRVLNLSPLDAAQVQELLESIGMRSGSWSPVLTQALYESTGGIPFLIFETLRHVLDLQLLARDDEGDWQCNDIEGLRREMTIGTVEGRRIKNLKESDRVILLTLAVADAPLILEHLASAIGIETGKAARQTAKLELHGFVTRGSHGFGIAHDTIAEAIVAQSDKSEIASLRKTLGALIAHQVTDPDAMRLAASHFFHAGDNDGLSRLYRTWVGFWRGRGDRRELADLAAALVGRDRSDESVGALAASLPLLHRIRFYPRLGAVAAGLILIGGLVGAAGAAKVFAPPPYSIHVSSTPSGIQPNPDNSLGLVMFPAPVVEFRNRDGTLATDRNDTVKVSLIVGGGELRGNMVQVASRGRAVFHNLGLSEVQSGFYVLGFETTIGIAVTDSFELAYKNALEIVGGIINDQPLDPDAPSISVAPGDQITGIIDIVYSTGWAAASVVLAIGPTWGPHDAVAPGRALPTPLRNGTARLLLGPENQNHLQMFAPAQPGTYHIIIAFAGEEDSHDVFSQTNWAYGDPVWNDGNDIADWSPDQLRQARETGEVIGTTLFPKQSMGTSRGYYAREIPARVIDVVVQEP